MPSRTLPTGERIIAEYVDVDDQSFTRLPDGRNIATPLFGLTEEQVERIRQGYICIKCLEAYDSAFPDECSVCHFPMKTKQIEEFGKTYRGEIAFGPSTTLEEEAGIMQEMREKESYDRMRKLGLILPEWY